VTVSWSKEFTVRPPTMADVEAAVELSNACMLELIGKPWETVEGYRTEWQSPTLSLERDKLLVFHGKEMVGHAGVWDQAPHVHIYAWAYVHPQWRGQGIGSYLGEWIEERARTAIDEAPEGTRVVVGQRKLTSDAPGHEYLKAHGYRAVRTTSRLLIELDSPSPEPVFPEGIVVRTFDLEVPVRALNALVDAERDIFRDHWGYVEQPLEEDRAEWQHWIDHDPDHDPSLWFLAMAGAEITGVSLCLPKMAEDPEMGYIMSVGVRRAYRRQGIALALLHHTFGEFHRRGTKRVSLDVDASSLTGATRLYEKAGMHLQRQMLEYEKVLREGKDLSTQTLDDTG
jgi:GNAT superfamily N-acetyltransferase